MILYVQTPSIPRSQLHNSLIKTMIEYLDKCPQFSEIRWFVNLDIIKTSKIKKSTYIWEDFNITKQNFIDISKNLVNTSLNLHTSKNPCFYLAFRYLTLSVLKDISKSKLDHSEYCVMWLEDDWSFIDKKGFSENLDKFLDNLQYKCYILYRNKINMGGNPDIIKGDIFQLFKDVNLDIDNKRDPENIRKNYVWVPNIFNNPNNSFSLKTLNGDINHVGRSYQTKILSANVVEGEQGDEWRRQLNIAKNWTFSDKPGISPDKNYTYAK